MTAREKPRHMDTSWEEARRRLAPHPPSPACLLGALIDDMP
jgi:hypothetical protein